MYVNTPHKGFNNVLEEIDRMIKNDGLKSGDKLPSERHLSDLLNISRSSIREALRALEILGVIETRRGEGTFLSDMDNNQFFELISGYLITSRAQKGEINDFIHMIEQSIPQDDTKTIEERLNNRNTIMFRVWRLLKHYEATYKEEV